jgi:prepilin-type processing-associated H-X9-DG protein
MIEPQAQPGNSAGPVLDYRGARTERPPKRTRRWIPVLIASLLTGLFVLYAMRMTSGRHRGYPADRIKCASNLRQIGMALMIYSNEHGGMYPPTLDEVLIEGDITSEVFICPKTAHERATGPTTQAVLQDFHKPGHNSYLYVIGSVPEKSLTSSHVVAYEPPTNHAGDGMNVLFGDGQVDWLSAREAARVIAELQAGFNPPRSPSTRSTATRPSGGSAGG